MEYRAERRMSPLKRAAIGAIAVAAVFGYGSCRYNVGFREGSAPITASENFGQHETAPGFLAYPGTFGIRNQLNEKDQTEAYLRNKRTGEEVPLTDATWRLLDTYQGHESALEFAMQITDKLPGGE